MELVVTNLKKEKRREDDANIEDIPNKNFMDANKRRKKNPRRFGPF